jgi:hypothetical protein
MGVEAVMVGEAEVTDLEAEVTDLGAEVTLLSGVVMH